MAVRFLLLITLSDPDSFRNYAFELFSSDSRLKYTTTFKNGFQVHPPEESFEARFPKFRKDLASLVNQLLAKEIQFTHGLDDSYSSITINKGPGFHFTHKVPGTCPHVDPCHISSFIYLNTTEMCSGGTGIYRHIPTGNTRIVQNSCLLKHLENDHTNTPVSESAGEWELLHLIEMRYNRVGIFNASNIHKIYLDPNGHPYSNDMFNMRLTLNTFFTYTKVTP